MACAQNGLEVGHKSLSVAVPPPKFVSQNFVLPFESASNCVSTHPETLINDRKKIYRNNFADIAEIISVLTGMQHVICEVIFPPSVFFG